MALTPNISSAELARERELNKYFQPWVHSTATEIKGNTYLGAEEGPQHVPLHHDTTLTALAQLAALRLNVKRCMISLVDVDTQVILAEATQTISLVHEARHAAGDHLWLGRASLPRDQCIDEKVLSAKSVYTDGQGREVQLDALVINNVQEDETLKNRHYGGSDPGIRFYAGVPIITKHGHSIGTYAVTDTEPRPKGLSIDEVLFMKDVSQVIGEHLERVKGAVGRDSCEAFAKGITSFLECLSTLKYKLNSKTDQSLHEVSNQEDDSDVRSTDPQPDSTQKRSDIAASPASSRQDSASSPVRKNSTYERANSNIQPRFSRTTSSYSTEISDTSRMNTNDVFTRASQLICERVKARGCVFLDATSNLPPEQPEQGFTRSSRSRSSVTQPHELNEESDGGKMDLDGEDEEKPKTKTKSGSEVNLDQGDAGDRSDNMADILGRSTVGGNQSDRRSIKRQGLDKCLRLYPDGKCFYLHRGVVVATSNPSPGAKPTEANATPPSSNAQAKNARYAPDYLPQDLLEHIEDAKWLIFLPLFDYTKGQWFAGGFIWAQDFTSGDPEEMFPYIKAFAICLMSEIASMGALTTNLAKSTFIASISHDLRSPLHGMLGSLEFLEDTMTSAYQTSLAGSIETCGKTLLDTIDHLLDYAKINDLNRTTSNSDPSRGRKAHNSRHSDGKPAITGPTSNTFDCALLLEEVVEAVFAGQTFRKMNLRRQDSVDRIASDIRSIGMDDCTTAEDEIHAGSAKFSGKVFFILNIQKSDFLCLQGQTGALRRVIMNVVGNAIKYCRRGSIEISLAVARTGASRVNVELSVKDTGIGMSQTFLENHLFKAFSQEDSFTAGAGLGLSITSQIVQSMDGKIRVDSEKGVGTHVNITIPMVLSESGNCKEDEILHAAVRATSGKTVCLLNPLLEEKQVAKGQLSKLTSSISNMCKDWFDMEFSQGTSVEGDPEATVYLYAEPPPIEYLLKQHSERREMGKTGKEAAMLIICTNAFEAATLREAGISQLTSLGRIVEVVSQPVGVRKLAKTFLQCLQRVEASGASSEQPSLSDAASQSSSMDEAQQRASKIEWISSPVVYDQAGSRHRPSIEPLKWKSEYVQSKATPSRDGQSGEQGATFGDIKAGDIPGLENLPHKDSQNGTKRLPHILLVDDNAINLRLLVTFMKKIKLPYAEAVNGLEALTKFKEADHPFHYVLMDLQMPVMDGLESTRKIREFEQETKARSRSIIIAITGVGNESVRQEAMDAGMSQFLTKPVKFKVLQQLLEQGNTP